MDSAVFSEQEQTPNTHAVYDWLCFLFEYACECLNEHIHNLHVHTYIHIHSYMMSWIIWFLYIYKSRCSRLYVL